MNRLYLLIILFILGFACTTSRYNASGSRPNIILIFIDDLGYTDAGFMGSRFYETPHLDHLATQGMIFTNAYSSAANCAPSRASMMSGQYPSRHGIYTVNSSERGRSAFRKIIPTPNNITIPDSIYLLPEVLRDNGYITCHAGKWHLSDDPLDHGFDYNIGGSHAGHPDSYFYPFKTRIQQNGHYHGIEIGSKNEEVYLTDRLTTHVIRLLDTLSADGPFFLNFAPYTVHGPLQAKNKKIKKYDGKESNAQHYHSQYAGMIESMDENIGRLLTALESKGLMENTLIIFTSDNGGVYKTSKQWPLRSGKGSYYEGGIRAPMVAYWKGKIPEGTRSDIPVTNIDFYPTFLDVAGIRTTETLLDGHSIKTVLTGEDKLSSRSLFWHFPIYLEGGHSESQDPIFRTRPGSAIRDGDWKLIQYFEDNKLELYNLKEDLSEKVNLAESLPEKADELLQKLVKIRTETNSPVPSTMNPEYDRLAELQAIDN